MRMEELWMGTRDQQWDKDGEKSTKQKIGFSVLNLLLKSKHDERSCRSEHYPWSFEETAFPPSQTYPLPFPLPRRSLRDMKVQTDPIAAAEMEGNGMRGREV
ncbi:hypothetical protein BaRGS_00031288 [Batillaria attramentaria]|uniref:Uncharacterized protein n=1 Tax=Batillaria attramentaria TaxID=370345 RepID=A0ABD0JRZ2_9CAEN